MAAQFTGGFAEPPIESAAIFRAVLAAMSRPGLQVALATGVRPPSPLSTETAAVLLTLVDADTPLWVAPDLATADVCEWLRFHTGTPLVAEAEEAMFAVVTSSSPLAALPKLSIGSADYPDRATTLILQLARLGSEPTHELTGPGIESVVRFDAAVLPDEILTLIGRNRALYPLGIDLIVTTPGTVVGLPRSTAVRCLETA